MTANGDGVVLVNPFEVPPDRDDDFEAGWQRSRDFLAGQDGYLDTALHRSLMPNAEFRYVNVAHWRSPQTFQAALGRPDFPGRQAPFPAHPALYQVVVEDPAPAEPTAGEPAVLINLFDVPDGADDQFLPVWERTRKVLRTRPGYLAARLHRSLSPEARFRFVNVAGWHDPQAFQQAIGDPGFREAAAGIQRWAHASLYQVVRR
jgi:heme-degrading monooxygenase HmoA